MQYGSGKFPLVHEAHPRVCQLPFALIAYPHYGGSRKKEVKPKFKGSDKRQVHSTVAGNPRSKIICNYCKKLGHIEANCFKKKASEGSSNGRANKKTNLGTEEHFDLEKDVDNAIVIDSDEYNLVMDLDNLHFLETMLLEDGEKKEVILPPLKSFLHC